MDFAVLAEAVVLSGRTVLDVGCGDGALVRRLAAAGADAIGVDVRVDRAYGGRFLVGGAEALPLEDASVDVAVLMRSLHHVPDPDAAFPELRRVVRDVVYIAEPLAEGEFFELMRPVDDETAVRAAAQAAIARADGFERLRTFEYYSPIGLDSFEAFERMVLGADPDRRARFASVERQLRERFRPGGYESRTRVDLLRVVSSRP
ncbi:MAG TPA: class I SAM-dependent methyltransferase [Solirubrobacter sp.]|nr:class I SAM-dependent methyltransferase [Solirubrobacter sp.]